MCDLYMYMYETTFQQLPHQTISVAAATSWCNPAGEVVFTALGIDPSCWNYAGAIFPLKTIRCYCFQSDYFGM